MPLRYTESLPFGKKGMNRRPQNYLIRISLEF